MYVRIYPADNSAISPDCDGRMAFGCYLASNNIKNTPRPSGSNVICFENFEACKDGTDYFSKIGYMSYTGTATLGKDTFSGMELANAMVRPGYIFLGTSTSITHGIGAIKLTALGAGSHDITIQVKVCVYMGINGVAENNAIKLLRAGTGGTITQQFVWDTPPEDDYFGWHVGTAKVSGATSATTLAIKTNGGTAPCRFFLDDLLVTKD